MSPNVQTSESRLGVKQTQEIATPRLVGARNDSPFVTLTLNEVFPFIDPKIQHGKSVIRGTRVPVARIIAELAGGMTGEEVMREYEITKEDVAAALAYAADLVVAS